MELPSVTRRQFVASSAAAGTGAVLSHIAPNLLAQTIPSSELHTVPEWATRVHRWAQLTLVEDDPAHFDTGFWLDYFKRTRSDGACLSAGGCVAYYPTQVPFHHRSAWLGNRDVFGELVEGCRKMGMSVLARTDPHATYDDAKAAHPDWIAVEANGQPRRHWASPEMWVTCGLGPYNFEFMRDVHKEIMSRYRVDGIFMNRWDGSGDCYCVHCQQNFKAATGYDLPRSVNRRDAVGRAFFLWRQQRLTEVVDVWNADIRAINPQSSIIPNNGGGATSGLDTIALGKRAPLMAADRQARHGLALPWIVGKSAKEYRATMGTKPVIGLFGLGLEEQYRWKDSVNSNAEIRIWALEAIANGMKPWFCKFSGTLHDERWLNGIAELYQWTAENQAYLEQKQPLARVGLVFSQQTAWYHDGARGSTVEDHALGWYQALVESRVPFEMVHDRMLDAESLRPYRTLILPNIAALSDAQCAQLSAFVRNGGNIICTHQTSLFDELGAPRENFALAGLFGVDFAGKTDGPMQNSYIRLEHEAYPHHPLFAGLEDAPRIINGVTRVEVTPRAPFAETPFTLIPSYPDLPMEKVYPRVAKTDISCLYLRQTGAGRVAYIPFDLDRTFWEVLNPDHLQMLRNTLAWAHNEPQTIEVEGPGLLDVTAWRNNGSVTVHLVNLTNPMAMKGPYRNFFPIGAQTVRLRLPSNMRPSHARLLVAGREVPIMRTGDSLQVTVPSILDHEVLAFDI